MGAAALIASVAGSAGAATLVRPGPELNGWKLIAESDTLDPQLNVNAGWVDAATSGGASGSVVLPPAAGVTVGLHTDNYKGTRIADITAMAVTVKTVGSGLGPAVVLRTSPTVTRPIACNVVFDMPLTSSWTTYSLTDDANAFWTVNANIPPCPALFNAPWSAVKAALGGLTDTIDDGVLDGAAGIRIRAGDSNPANSYAKTYVDSFSFNGEVADFEPPTAALSGGTASIPAGGSIDLPVAAALSGPNQPGFGNSLGPITGNGGLVSSAQLAVSSTPAGLCTLTPGTVTFGLESGLSLEKPRFSTQSLKVSTLAGAGGTCTVTLASAVNATTAGKLTITVTPTPTVPVTTPPITTPPAATPVTCSAKAVSGSSKIKVNMGPNLPGTGYYKFRIDVKRSGAWFRYLKNYKTQGAGETRTVNVPKGTYKVKCYGQTEAQDATSKVLKIKK